MTERTARARARMRELGVDVLLLSVGPDLPYLTGYEAMPLERLTMLVLPAEGPAALVVPRLEAPRVTEHPDLFWAIRGGGGNFGVVTSFEYRLHEVGPIVVAGMALLAAANAYDYLAIYPSRLRTPFEAAHNAAKIPIEIFPVPAESPISFTVCTTNSDAEPGITRIK